ncbi:MAG: bifunctional 3-(3-hydroxy-phenyl)propionate/3-hydroxycinnamic acid hydroxylase [Rhizobiaceae bacterium]
MGSNSNNRFDVVIVGLGPTGAMIANLLGMEGLSVLALDREEDIYDLPRAVHFDDEIKRAFQTIGISGQLTDYVIVNKGMRFLDYDSNLLLDWPREQQITSNGWHASYRFHQPDLERIMRAALARYPNVVMRLGCTVDQLVEREDSVPVHFTSEQAGRSEVVSADYVIGADGARSIVRDAMGAKMKMLGFQQRWLVTDLLLKHPMPELGDYTVQYCDDVRPATYCRNPGMRRRWEFALHDHETDEEMTKPEMVWSLLKRWITPDDAELERIAVYTFKSCVADRWRKGRMFVAGDAAHLTPPFMGQGMCAGIRDAVNLSWKISRVLRYHVPDELLDSYESERKPNVTQFIETAVGLGELINRMGTGEQLAKDKKMESIQSSLGPGLGIETDPLRGKLFPQFRLSSGEMLDDFIGTNAFVARKNGSNESVDGLTVLTGKQEPALVSVLGDLQADEVIVRPDRYILASSGNDLQALECRKNELAMILRYENHTKVN